jgi:uncharacterized protein YoaH (UPF0181 family)
MLFPLTVGVGDAQIEKLTAMYKLAYKDIVAELKGATDFGVYNRKAILSQIEVILTDLGTNVQEFIEREIPRNYVLGLNQAVRQLNSFGAGLEVDMALNKLHTQAIDLMVGDTLKAFGESITGVQRSAEALLSKAVKEQIQMRMAEGVTKGETLKEVKAYLSGILSDNQITSLIDKAGHEWTLDRYTEMLVRTKTAEARNRGLINRSIEVDNDLVIVSDHSSTCDVCGPWEGKVLSLTGKTEGYPTLDEAESDGLFHPNCQHAINVYDAEYQGRLRSYNPDTGKYEMPDEETA